MIYIKRPPTPPPTNEIDMDTFCETASGGGDIKSISNWHPAVSGRAEEVYNKHGMLLGTLVFIWSMDKKGLQWDSLQK